MVKKNIKNSKTTTTSKTKKTSSPSPTPTVVVTDKLPPTPLDVAKTIVDPEQKKIQDMLLLAQLEYASIKSKVVKEKKREIENLEQMIKEFMGPFMIIGYDLNNNPIEMVSADSSADQDAILERLRRVMYKINQNIANSNGSDPYGFNPN